MRAALAEGWRPKATKHPRRHGYTETRTYDRAGRLTDVQNANGTGTLSRYTYTLDPVGNPTQVSGTDPTTTFSYDALDRLTQACWSPPNCSGTGDSFVTYTYDGVGNRLTEVKPGGTTTYTYNASDQLTSTSGPGGTVNYTYDDNGNETGAGSASYGYDVASQMTSATVGGTTTSYTYDGDGRRLQASVGSNATDKTNYLWDPTLPYGQIALERDNQPVLLKRYIFGVDRVSMRSGSADYYFHRDGLGSVTGLTSSSGATEWAYSYEPFGASRTTNQVDPSAPSNEMRFAGELLDPTGLYHLRARQYDPGTGRFLQLDPLASSVTDSYAGSYVYVREQPTVAVDPLGLGLCLLGHNSSGGCYLGSVPDIASEIIRNPVSSWQAGIPQVKELARDWWTGIQQLGQVVKHYGGTCLSIGAVGAQYSKLPGPWGTVAGFVGGCVIGVAAQYITEKATGTAQAAEMSSSAYAPLGSSSGVNTK